MTCRLGHAPAAMLQPHVLPEIDHLLGNVVALVAGVTQLEVYVLFVHF